MGATDSRTASDGSGGYSSHGLRVRIITCTPYEVQAGIYRKGEVVGRALYSYGCIRQLPNPARVLERHWLELDWTGQCKDETHKHDGGMRDNGRRVLRVSQAIASARSVRQIARPRTEAAKTARSDEAAP